MHEGGWPAQPSLAMATARTSERNNIANIRFDGYPARRSIPLMPSRSLYVIPVDSRLLAAPGCGHEKRVAFSCKRRGICPSCGARRMAETAAWLVDRVIPRVPVRQWVLSFPIPLRSALRRAPRTARPGIADHPPGHCDASHPGRRASNAAKRPPARSPSSSALARRRILTFICMLWCSMGCIAPRARAQRYSTRRPR